MQSQSRRLSTLTASLIAFSLCLCLTATHALAGGTFGFITTELPTGRPGNLYVSRLLTVNPAGPITFNVAAGSADPLPAEITLDPQTGFLTGTPVAGTDDVTFEATDGTSVITLVAEIDIGNSGSGGGAGPTFANTSLASGRVGMAYADTLTTANGVGPFTFGASGLPAGLSLDGQTGEISGESIEAGTFDVNLSITDAGDSDNKGFTRIPLVILPAANDFQFSTVLLNNGEIGTTYLDTLATTGAPDPTVQFSTSGLPDGLMVDTLTGRISGTPLAAGTFRVRLTATSGGEMISTSLVMWIVASNTSNFYWDFFGLPIATTGVLFDALPGVFLVTQNGGAVDYSVRGLPNGIVYDAVSGELTGTTNEVGLFPVVFTAFDADSGETLKLTTQFPVLRSGGGDSNALSTNLWPANQSYSAAKGSWKALYVYNADRRSGGMAFDPATDRFDISLGSRIVSLLPGQLTDAKGRFVFKSGKGVLPALSLTVDPRMQTIKFLTKGDSLTDSVPGDLLNVVFLGDRAYQLTEFHDAKGKFKPPFGLRSTAFVVAKGKVLVKGGGLDSLSLGGLLADPAFSYTSGVSILNVRLLSQGIALIDRDFTILGASKESIDKKTGSTIFGLKSLRDTSPVDTVSKFSYKSSSGKMALSMNNVDLSALPAGEAHVTLELTVDAHTYSTSVTLFESKSGKYSTMMPK